jgi:hypothetical protein
VETQWSAPNIQLYLHLSRSKHSWLNSELCQSTWVWKVLSFNPRFELPVCCYLYNGFLYALGFLNLDWVLLYVGPFIFWNCRFPHCCILESKSLCRAWLLQHNILLEMIWKSLIWHWNSETS